MVRVAAVSLSLLSSVPLAPSYQGQLPPSTTTWAGKVTMTGDVPVPADAMLVVQPSTTVTAAAIDAVGGGNATTVELMVIGTLTVSGVSGGGVTFTGAGTGGADGGDAVRLDAVPADGERQRRLRDGHGDAGNSAAGARRDCHLQRQRA
jgi:hypothetical protein